MDYKCKKCGEPLTSITWYAWAKKIHYYSCKKCICKYQGAYAKKWRAENKEYFKEQRKLKDRRYHLKKSYGASLESYAKQFDQQNGCCAICGRHQSEFKIKLSLDHNHRTKKVRGLLCPNCNQGLGHLLVDTQGINLLCSAISYLRKYDNA